MTTGNPLESNVSVVQDPVRVSQFIRGTDGVLREYRPGKTVIVRANRDGVTYFWTGVPEEIALSLFTPGAHPAVADMVRALGPCTVDLTERVTAGGG